VSGFGEVSLVSLETGEGGGREKGGGKREEGGGGRKEEGRGRKEEDEGGRRREAGRLSPSRASVS
jgi:hypothetical protein